MQNAVTITGVGISSCSTSEAAPDVAASAAGACQFAGREVRTSDPDVGSDSDCSSLGREVTPCEHYVLCPENTTIRRENTQARLDRFCNIEVLNRSDGQGEWISRRVINSVGHDDVPHHGHGRDISGVVDPETAYNMRAQCIVASMSPDGRALLVANGFVSTLWDAGDNGLWQGEPVFKFNGAYRRSDWRFMVGEEREEGEGPGNVSIVILEQGSPGQWVERLRDDTYAGWIRDVSFSPDGYIAIVDQDKNLGIYAENPEGQMVRKITMKCPDRWEWTRWNNTLTGTAQRAVSVTIGFRDLDTEELNSITISLGTNENKAEEMPGWSLSDWIGKLSLTGAQCSRYSE